MSVAVLKWSSGLGKVAVLHLPGILNLKVLSYLSMVC